MNAKHPSESFTILTDIVLPGESNPLHNLFGGDLLARMDRAGSIAARRHSDHFVVTASVNHVAFEKPIPLGTIIILEAKVSRAFKTSMEVIIDVFIEDTHTGERTQTNQAIYTFVAVDDHVRPVVIPPIEPQTEEEIKRYDAALRRRQLSLVLAGRMVASEATELKALFEEN